MMNPYQNIRPDGDLRVVEGAFPQGPTGFEIHQAQHYPGGAQVHGQPGQASRVVRRRHGDQLPAGTVLK